MVKASKGKRKGERKLERARRKESTTFFSEKKKRICCYGRS